MIKIPKLELAYIGGFFDGEGSITISRTKATKPYRNRRLDLHVSVLQANEWIIRSLQFKFGGCVSAITKRCSWFRQSWRWDISSKQALGFLEIILPYLKLKRAEAELAIQFQRNKLPPGFQPDTKRQAQRSVEDAQRLLMKTLKDKSG